MSKFMSDFSEFIAQQPFDLIRYSQVVDDGEIETFVGTKANPCQNTYSVAKTFTATAIGLLFDQGKLTVDEKITDILADELPESGMDPRWHDVTVDMALTHRAGLPGGFLDIDVHKSSEFTDDFLRYMLTYPLDYTPGTDSKYSDGAFYLLSRIVEKKSGLCLDNFLWKELLVKLDYQEMAWSHCPKGHAMGATGLYISSEDMVKLGMVYLNGGLYRGQRVLSQQWCTMALEREYGIDKSDDGKMHAKGGMFGQKLFIIPEKKLAGAVQAYGGDSGAVARWVQNYFA